MEESVAIRVSHLSKKYTIGSSKSNSLRHSLGDFFRKKQQTTEEFWALKDVNFSIKKGDVVGIIGKNGAGKSTLLKILSQITKPTAGKIEINGRIASLLEVGTGFHHELTGRENIYLNGTILGMTRKEVAAKFDEIVEFSGVGKFIDTPVKHYSSGMYVRLAFAVAAHLEPEILVIDEVLAVGDAEFQKKCLGKMQDVAGQGRTVLFVSHNMAAVKSLCNTAIYMENGTVKFAGNIDIAFDQYNRTQFETKKVHEFHDIKRLDRGQKQITLQKAIFDKDRYSPQSSLNLKIILCDTDAFSGKIDLIVFFIDNLENIIYQCDTRALDLKFDYSKEKEISLKLEQIALSPGHYKIGIWLGGNGFEQDYVDNIPFVIDNGSIYPIITTEIVSLVQTKYTFNCTND